eukprot:gnl/MRDRNA2_/MRDRNA2_91831_c0_seq1.p1 gnl/MRDRNA2_/MRDRNA2_91831_c0~~gnl/MRDRNA2_/MRDRNA2_91831_c0_seq1.p1  ORF type:complete len:138 (-),score=38.68 gnl/MRDRNA2_/MRDRNA2_91831_c0_seq1:116-529(-)
MSVADLKKDWDKCLNTSGRDPSRCGKQESALRAASKSAGVDCCIDETIALMQCTAKASAKDGCAAAFINMRECNRAGGRQLVADGGGYAVAAGAGKLFDPAAVSLTGSAPPLRTLDGMKKAGEEMLKAFGIAGGVRF